MLSKRERLDKLNILIELKPKINTELSNLLNEKTGALLDKNDFVVMYTEKIIKIVSEIF